MRKFICVLLAVMMILSAGVPAAFAAHHGHHRRCIVPQVQAAPEDTAAEYCRFTDENQDDICDNCDNICSNCEKGRDEDCDGICDSCSKVCHKCDGAKDADDDGICDGCSMCPYESDPSGKGTCRCAKVCKSADENKHCSTPVTYKYCTRGFHHH